MTAAERPIVLGAGVAGIAAAMRLADAGLEPILIESRPYVGGRVRSFRHKRTGTEIDNGRHLLMGCYTDTIDLLKRLGTDRLCTFDSGLALHYCDPDRGRTHLSLPRYLPPPFDLLVALIRFRFLSWKDRIDVIRFGLAVRRTETNEDETVDEFLARLGQSENVRRHLWNPLVIAALNTPPDVASARLFLEVVKLAVLPGGTETGLVTPTVGLSHLLSPSVAYIQERGGKVRLGTTIHDLEREQSNGRTRWILNRDRTDECSTNRLISAVPATVFAKLFRSELPALADNIGLILHSPILSLYLWIDPPNAEIPSIAVLFGTTIEWVANRGSVSMSGTDRPVGLLEGIVSAADRVSDVSDDSLVETAVEDLRRCGYLKKTHVLLDAQVIREKRATLASTPVIDRLRPPSGPIADGLFLAGAWTQTDLPGTIEGAARSGKGAAEALINEEPTP